MSWVTAQVSSNSHRPPSSMAAQPAAVSSPLKPYDSSKPPVRSSTARGKTRLQPSKYGLGTRVSRKTVCGAVRVRRRRAQDRPLQHAEVGRGPRRRQRLGQPVGAGHAVVVGERDQRRPRRSPAEVAGGRGPAVHVDPERPQLDGESRRPSGRGPPTSRHRSRCRRRSPRSAGGRATGPRARRRASGAAPLAGRWTPPPTPPAARRPSQHDHPAPQRPAEVPRDRGRVDHGRTPPGREAGASSSRRLARYGSARRASAGRRLAVTAPNSGEREGQALRAVQPGSAERAARAGRGAGPPAPRGCSRATRAGSASARSAPPGRG